MQHCVQVEHNLYWSCNFPLNVKCVICVQASNGIKYDIIVFQTSHLTRRLPLFGWTRTAPDLYRWLWQKLTEKCWQVKNYTLHLNWVPKHLSQDEKVSIKITDNQTRFSAPKVGRWKFSCIWILLFRCCDVTQSLPNWPLPVLSSLPETKSSPGVHLLLTNRLRFHSPSLSFFSVLKLPSLFCFLSSINLISPSRPNREASLSPFSLSFFLYSSSPPLSLSLARFPPVVTHSFPLHAPSLFPGFGCDGSGQAEGCSVREEETGVAQGEEIGVKEQRARAPDGGRLHPDPSPGRGGGGGRAGQGTYDHRAGAH